MVVRDSPSVLRRVVVLSKYVLRGFSAMNGNPPRPDVTRSFLRRHGLLDELRPAERTLLLEESEPSQAQITEATWRSEALVALRWAIGDRETLDVGGQVSLVQAVPDVDTDEDVRALFATRRLRPEAELSRALERWFVVCWRLRLREHGVSRLDLDGWIARSPHLTHLRPGEVPTIDGDLSLDAAVMEVAADELGIDSEGWNVEAGRIAIHGCTPGMLTEGENVLRVATERLRALRWLCGVTEHLDHEPQGLYRPDSTAARDKSLLHGADAPPAVRPGEYDALGGLALHRAAWRGDVTTLRALLDEGADAFVPDIDGDLTIHCAVLGGHRPAIEAVLAADPSASMVCDADGLVPLHLAASRGDVNAIEALVGGPDRLSRGLDPSDGDGGMALREAVRHGHLAAVTRLIELNAAPHGTLDAAMEHDRADMVRHLADHGVAIDEIDHGTTPMYRALFGGKLASAAALLDLGADAAFAHESGTTALHVAADRGATELCLRLLDGGAELDRRLQTMGAVHFALLGGHAECAFALIERGADVAGCDQPPLALALRGGAVPLIRWCIDRGEPLGHAPHAPRDCARQGWAEALAVLISAGASPGAANEQGITPLHLAADRGHTQCVRVLLEAGAPVDAASTDRGFTALHLAAMHGHDDCVRLLLAAGASPRTHDADGHSALDWATDGTHDACVALLA